MNTTDKTITLIGRLLRQAESTTHPEEAATFAARAQTLATRHSVDLAIAQSKLAASEERQHPEQRTVDVDGSVRARAHYVRLYLAIADANCVRCYIRSDSSVVYATGFPSDLDLVDSIYSTLVVHMSATCAAYMQSGDYRHETVARFNRWLGTWEDKPVHGATARADYYRAYVARISQRLSTAAREAEAQAEAEQGNSHGGSGNEKALVSTALVLRQKRRDVAESYEDHGRQIGARGSYKGGRRSRDRGRVGSAVDHGRAAANDADLTPPSAPRAAISA